MRSQDIPHYVREELTEMIVDTLQDYNGYVCDLHNEVFNMDYFIIGNYEAKKWLENNWGVFEAIEEIREYEQDNFGEVNTDFSSPEHVCNMLVYIIGEVLISELESVSDHWNELMDDDIRQEILEELGADEDD